MKMFAWIGAALVASAVLGSARPSHAGCAISLKGSYDTAVRGHDETLKLVVYLNGAKRNDKTSQVRKKLGTWAKIKDCDWSIRSYSLGGSFTVACKLTFGCSSKRRYRVFVVAEDSSGLLVNSAFKYYPSESDWTTSTTVDLGDLGKLF